MIEKAAKRWMKFVAVSLWMVTAGMMLSSIWYVVFQPYRRQQQTAKLVATLGGRVVMDEAPWWIPRFGNDLKKIVLIDVADHDGPADYLEAVTALPELETLVVGGPQFGDEQLRRLFGLLTLRGVVLDSTEVTDAGLAEIHQALPALEVHRSPRRAIRAAERAIANVWGSVMVSLIDKKPSIQPLPPLAAVVGPEYFDDLTACQLYSDAQILHLKHFPNIQKLRVIGADVTDAGMMQVGTLASLTSLTLEYDTRVTDAGLAHLKSLTNLAELSVTDAHDGGHGLISDAKVTDAGIAHLAHLPNLRSLWIDGAGITDAGLAHLADFPNLRSLSIHGAGISEAGLAHLAHLTNLTSLTFGPYITDDGLALLKDLINLEVLYFNCAEISGAGLAHIQGLPKLATLYLVDADITDDELAHLAEFKKLTQLWFYNQEIRDGGMADLQKSLPNCQLHYDSRSGPYGTWIPVAIERDGVWQAATEQEKQERRLVLKGRKFELGAGAGRVTGMSVLGEMVVDQELGTMQLTIDLTVVAARGELVPADDRPRLLGIIEFVDEDSLKLCLDTQERPQEFKSGKGRDAVEYERIHP
jgi:hypothetical protein